MDLFTKELPFKVRVAMARHWITGHAIELSIGGQPADSLPKELQCLQTLVTEDMVDIGIDALATLNAQTIQLMIDEVAHECMACPNCLTDLIFNGDEEDEK
jgi:hypothetical protein